jgi:hypothetical protein
MPLSKNPGKDLGKNSKSQNMAKVAQNQQAVCICTFS